MMVEKDLGPFCDTFYLEAHRKIYESFYGYFSPNVIFGTCPFPAGNYSMSDYPFSEEDFEKLVPPYIPGSEKWRIFLKLSINGTAKGGGVYDFTISHKDRMTVLSG
jgi:hypothetical protein